MKLTIKLGKDISTDEVPVLGVTGNILEQADITGLTREDFSEYIEPDKSYAVVKIPDVLGLSREVRSSFAKRCLEENFTGEESDTTLESFIRSQDYSTVGIAVQKVMRAFEKKESIADLVQKVSNIEDDLSHGLPAPGLHNLLSDERVCVALESTNDTNMLIPFDEKKLRSIKVPLYILLDVSFSMANEDRYIYSQILVKKLREYVNKKAFIEEHEVVIYSAIEDIASIGLTCPDLITPKSETATGAALEFVVNRIKQRHAYNPVCLALVTDGEPTVGSDKYGISPQEHAEEVAKKIPGNVLLVQFAFAPLDPCKEPQTFQRYLEAINNITNNAPQGQTIVLTRQGEVYLPYLVFAGHQVCKINFI